MTVPRPSRPTPAPAATNETRPAGEVRLIGGRWKRSKLAVPSRPGLRPTPDRVRETLFNWLGQTLPGLHVLDAFAGSGALGFEAASRGAARVCMVEVDPVLMTGLKATRDRLGAEAVELVRGDAMDWMRRSPPQSFDLIFLDPPFGQQLFAAALERALPLLRPDGWIYLEADREFGHEELAGSGLQVRRMGCAGMVHFHLLERLALPANDYTEPAHSAPMTAARSPS